MKTLIKKFIIRCFLWAKERTHKGKVKYLYFNNNSSDLLVVFSGFSGEKRRYNYVRGLQKVPIDRLYILDTFAYRGSYYLYENGGKEPEVLVKSLISKILENRGGYKNLYMAGSSKGGTAAIYYGLEFNADAIFAGACQFNLGTYLHCPKHERIFLSMMGENASEKECKILNDVMPNQLTKYRNYKGIVHVLYSKKDLTYERHIVDLLQSLKLNNIKYLEKEEAFETHQDVGFPFLAYLQAFFSKR